MTDRRPLRVLVVIDSLNWGGAEMLLADFAVGARPAGLRLSVAFLAQRSGSPAAARLRALGIDPALVPIEGLLRPAALRAVRRHMTEIAPDLVHTQLAYADVLGGAAARSLGVPAVSTIHVTRWEQGPRERLKAALAARVRRRCAARVVAVSDSARRAYVATGWDEPGRVITVRNGVAARPRPGAGAARRGELGLAGDDLVVGMVAVLRAGKGHELAIDAIAALRGRFPRLRLLVVGDGPAAPLVRQAAARLGRAAVLTGHRDDVMDLLDAMDVLVHPSRADALPTVLLEALVAGVPIVASDVGGIPEIVEHGRSGILFDAAAGAHGLTRALAPLLADSDLRGRLAEQGRRRFAADFSAERWAARMRCVYEDAIDARSARASSDRLPAGAGSRP